MIYGLYALCGSVGVLVGLTVLFRAEQRRGSRILLSGVRSYLDRAVVMVQSRISRIFDRLGAGVIRATFHYVMHQLLGGIIAVLTKMQQRLFRAYERNRWMRPGKKVSSGEPEGHLHEIAKHKGENALTEAQKRKLRSQ